MYWSWFLVLALSVSPGLAAVYHSIGKKYTYPKLKGDALFGFSVSSMATGNKAKLIVGAPKDDNTGGVYACDPTTTVCSPVSKNGISRFIEDESYTNQSYWFGATVSGAKDFFVACAPRFLAKSKNKDAYYDNNVGMFGKCYSYDDSSANPRLLFIFPQNLLESNATFESTMDTFGWSIYINSDDSVFVGGPGMTSGRLIRIKSDKVDYAYGSYSQFNASFNFGYSVTTGEFNPLGKLKKRTQVAVGSTYGRDGRGKVLFRSLDNISLYSTNELLSPTVGSMYGAVLCTASFDKNRKRSALLVGAPTFADDDGSDGYNTGAVYVYTGARKAGLLPDPITVIAGEAPNSFFGSAIVNVGDLNGDQKDEIAIAAPYYKITGCVYIYSGAHISIERKDLSEPLRPLQTIFPSSTATRTFGYSLGLLKDYDENGCDELAIGAPESNEVQVMNCIAVITVKLLKLPNTIKKAKGDDSKSLKVCLDVQFPDKPKNVIAEIKVKIDILHDGASLKEPSTGQLYFTIDKESGTRICQDIELFLKGTGKYNKEIWYELTATHMPSKEKDFKPENVNLSVKSELSVLDLIWAQECGNDTCLPVLDMTTKYSKKSPYVIGSTSSIDTRISVKNTGDVAYDACMHVNVTGAEITKLPNTCTALASNSLECRPQQPIYQTPNWDQDISIDTTSLTNENSSISVTVTLFTVCGNASTIFSNTQKKNFILDADADSVSVIGRTDEGVDTMVNLTRGDIAAQKQFFHIYMIHNRGLTNWVNVPIILDVPKQDIVKAAVYVDDNKCTSPGKTLYHCVVESIPKDSGKEVKIIFTVVPDTLSTAQQVIVSRTGSSYNTATDAKIGQEDIIVQSNIKVKLNKIVKPEEVKSELRLVEGVIPIWIIIAASILALIILVILFFILKECGCLKRKNKEELKRVRMSVRRQTMMRKSMMVRPPSADQEALVREAEASHESDKKKKDRRVVINDF